MPFASDHANKDRIQTITANTRVTPDTASKIHERDRICRKDALTGSVFHAMICRTPSFQIPLIPLASPQTPSQTPDSQTGAFSGSAFAGASNSASNDGDMALRGRCHRSLF